MQQREELIKDYFRCWVENDPAVLEKAFAEGIVYSESWGPEYRGLGQVKQWFSDWQQKGDVLEWNVKGFLHEGTRTAAEWYFRCVYDGKEDGFDGVSLLEFDKSGKIVSLKEFQSKAEHEFPYGRYGRGEEAVRIVAKEKPDEDILALFAAHDDFMLEHMEDDKKYYTRFSEAEKLACIWLAFAGDSPAGCAAFRKKADGVGELKRLYVKEEFRGRGLSRKLLEAVESHALGQGCGRLYLDTRLNLEPACSLYRSAGFEIAFRQGQYVQMEKELKNSGGERNESR